MSEHSTPLDEPKTPMWLPALGAALFALAGIWWATRPSDPPPAAAAAAPSASVTATAQARPAVPGH